MLKPTDKQKRPHNTGVYVFILRVTTIAQYASAESVRRQKVYLVAYQRLGSVVCKDVIDQGFLEEGRQGNHAVDRAFASDL